MVFANPIAKNSTELAVVSVLVIEFFVVKVEALIRIG
jgi:hypothetical protein